MTYVVRLERLDKREFPVIYRDPSLLKSTGRLIQICRAIAEVYPSMECVQSKDETVASMTFYLNGKPVILISAEEE
jgi:hypothetical protein